MDIPSDLGQIVEAEDVREAAERIRQFVHRTPVLSSRTLDERAGAAVFLKCENLQRVGAFKFRGAVNAILRLDESARGRGVITHSSGNHAQALALAGRMIGVPVVVVMPRTAPAVKRAATEGYGALVIPCEPTLESREETVAEWMARGGYHLIHPYDDWHVIAGQGTAALELMEEVPGLDLVMAPVGGGGLLAGTATWVKGAQTGCLVMGAEPAAADDAARSLREGKILPSDNPKTIADGLRTSLGKRSFAVIRQRVDDIVTVTEEEILEALKFVMERMKIVVEPSAVVGVAALLSRKLPVPARRVGVILSGGNVDLRALFEDFKERLG